MKLSIVGPDSPMREAAMTVLSPFDPTVSETADTETGCLVGVPDGDPLGLARELGGIARPTVLYAGREVDAAAVFAAGVDELVRRDGVGSETELRHTVERVTSHRVAADGGSQSSPSRRAFPLKELHEIATNRGLSRMEKIDELLQAGATQLGVEIAFLSRIEDGTQQVVRSVGEHPGLGPGDEAPLSETYCQYTIEQDTPLTSTNAAEDETIDETAYERFGLQCYLGATIAVNGERFGTVCFADPEQREASFDEHEQHFAEVLTDWIGYLLEQQAYEREIDQQQAFTESLMESLPDPLFATDEDGRLVRWNERFQRLVGDGDRTGADPASVVVESDRQAVRDAIDEALAGTDTAVEATIETAEGIEQPYEFSNAPLRHDDGSIAGVATVGRNVTERRNTQEQLSGILDTTQSLMQARDRTHVGEIAVAAAKELLGFDLSVFRLYDNEAGTLEPVAMTDETADILGERPVYTVGEGYPGEVFASGERRIIADLTAEAGGADLEPARSVIYYPVGVHGTISVCSTEPNAFDETDEQMLALLATSAAAACMRAKREQDVREAREHTEQVLDRVNGLVQNTVEVLVQAQSREELEAGVVEELASAEPYSFAWIGQPDVASELLSPTAWAGDASISIHGRSFPLSATNEPVSRAYRDEQPQVLSELDSGEWLDIVGDSPIRSLIAIPLVYKDANYGVLTVLAEDSDALDERERVVLESLGRVIANAINAIERGRILDATEIIELEFSINDPDLLFSRLSSTAGCTIESAGTDYRSDGSVRLYLTARGVDGETLLDIATDDVDVEDATLVVEHEEECLLELTVTDSLLATLTEYGAVPRAVTAENGTARFTVELPYESEARELFELVEGQYPSTELLGYHERERPVETRQEFTAALSERFTDRQETALRTAYLGGFFDWPRDIDGNELAAAMDISRPTYHQHLRSAQKKVFEELFE